MTSSPNPALVLAVPAPCVVVLMGASGAGKSTLARELADTTHAVAISYDQCREELTGDPSDQSATAAAVALAHRRVIARCTAGQATVVDATHTNWDERRPILTLVTSHSLPAVLVVVATPLQQCLHRQLTRSRRVPESVVRQQHANVLASLPRLHTEGWHSVHLLHTAHPRPERTA